VQVDMGFDPHAAVAARANGHPDCSVDAGIDKPGSGFAFQPAGCTPDVDCVGVRGLILAIDNIEPIADGATLFRCTVAIAPGAAPVRYPIGCFAALGSDADGAAVPLACVAGSVSVSRACPGDCDGDGQVTIDELLTGVNVILGTTGVVQCPSFDADFDDAVTVDELVTGVLDALNGCPGA